MTLHDASPRVPRGLPAWKGRHAGRWATLCVAGLVALVAALVLGRDLLFPREPPELANLPRCGRLAALGGTPGRDCAFVLVPASALDMSPARWLRVRFTRAAPTQPAAGLAIDDFRDTPVLGVVRETGLREAGVPFMLDVSGDDGDDIFVPVRRAGGDWTLSVWVSDFLQDYRRHTGPYVHAGDVPLGRVRHLQDNLFVVTTAERDGPWPMTLYRVTTAGLSTLGGLEASGRGDQCRLSGAATLAAGQIAEDQARWLCDDLSRRG